MQRKLWPAALVCALGVLCALVLVSCGAEEEIPEPSIPPEAMLQRAVDNLPSSFRAELEGEARGFGFDAEVVLTGGEAFVVLFGENYRARPEQVAAFEQRVTAVDPGALFGSPHYDGTEQVDGTACYRIAGGLSPQAAAEAGVPAPLGAASIEAAVGADDGVLRRLRVRADDLDLDVQLSDLGESLEPPPGGGFQPLDELVRRIRGL